MERGRQKRDERRRTSLSKVDSRIEDDAGGLGKSVDFVTWCEKKKKRAVSKAGRERVREKEGEARRDQASSKAHLRSKESPLCSS